jgi:hypothetical protein
LCKHASQLLKIVEVMLQHVVNDLAINVQVIVNQNVAKTYNPDPPLLEPCIEVPILSLDSGDVTVPVDDTQAQIGDHMVSHVGYGFYGQVQETFGVP